MTNTASSTATSATIPKRACLEPQPRGGQARVHQPAVHPGARTLRPVAARCSPGLKLHVKRVFIMDDAAQFLPLYLRFIKGVLDSSDLPLNVSRELLQKDPEVEAMKSALTKRALDMIGKLARDDADKYAKFWKEFGQVIKEGVAEDYGNREKLLPLLRFASTHEAADDDKVSLADYVARMQPGQDRIYYVLAESRAAARSSPFIEQLRARKVEVLLLGDRVDPWIMGQLQEFDGKSFQEAARGELDVSKLGDAPAGRKNPRQMPATRHCSSALQRRWATQWPG